MAVKIDMVKLLKYMLRRIWILIIVAEIGFGAMYYRAVFMQPDTYTAVATMYVFNGNPNVVNYQYTNTTDLNTAVMLVDTYKVVIRSNKVLNSVAERLGNSISAEYIDRTLGFGSVDKTGVMRISSTTTNPKLSMEICNAVADIAPAEIIRVVNAGNVQVVDYAELPERPNDKQGIKMGIIGALAGMVLAGGILVVLFLLNQKLTGSDELKERYNLQLLSIIGRVPAKKNKREYLLNENSEMQRKSEYQKLRVNLRFAMQNKTKTILISSAIPGECKSTVAANLSLSYAMTDSRVLLIDADLRKPTQNELFDLPKDAKGLSDILMGDASLQECVIRDVRKNLDIIPAGIGGANPADLLDSDRMRALLVAVQADEYSAIVVDLPPINIVSDALSLSDTNAGMLFVTRSGYSSHKEIRKALTAVEFADMLMLGMIMTCATKQSDDSYGRYYSGYYDKYGKRKKDKK